MLKGLKSHEGLFQISRDLFTSLQLIQSPNMKQNPLQLETLRLLELCEILKVIKKFRC